MAYLRELGIDPASPEIANISDDKAGKARDGSPYNLDTIAALRSEDALRHFIATRNFIWKYLKDTKTPFPSDEVYEIRYLKPEEMQFIRTALAGKLQPKAAAFLRELEIDPESEQITLILNDQVGLWSLHDCPYSLDALASFRDENAVRRFIATRNFARKYLKDTKTPFPPRDVYETRYLLPDEVQFILNELKKPFAR